ncbi:MAG TPA: hypothetical protein VGM68_07125 [Rhizomicrobium sp.]|jgi:hypothetical protein
MTEHPKPKMAVPPQTPPGLEVDEHGHPIPFDKRTEGDKEKVRAHIAAELHGSVKNPEGEAQTPSPVPRELPGTAKPHPKDPEGQQGGSPNRG